MSDTKKLSCGCTNHIICNKHAAAMLKVMQTPVVKPDAVPDPNIGMKFDGAKPRWSLLPQGVVSDIIEVLEFGARKYAPNNWIKVPDGRTRYYDALMRHMEAWWRGEKHDPETGKSHLAHAGCCLFFLMFLDKQTISKDPSEQRQDK